MVNVGRLAIGVVFLGLFAGFELHVAAIENLIPGSYAGLTSTNYLGFGFLITGLTSVGAAFSGPPSFRSSGAGAPGGVDPAAYAAAMMAMQQSQMSRGSGGAPVVNCPSCGVGNLPGAKFCQACAAPMGQPPKPAASAA